MLNDTICAISTSLKDGAISIVRLSGDDTFKIIQKISDIKKIEGNKIKYGHIFDNEEMIDEVLISFFVGPKSFTREDMAEINCHGGVYVTRLILNLLLANGARLAEPGEFTKRAYLNGRIDLSEAESTNDLINATNHLQAKSAIKGINGSIERLLSPLMEEIKTVIAQIEVNIDYPEYEDVLEMTNELVKPHINKWIKEMKDMINKADRFRVVKDGIKTVIVGKPNVGKSSLLNALLEKEKAIVTDIAGTTRDLVEGVVKLDNITLNLIDTAGIRDSEDIIEQIGIEKSKEALKDALEQLLVGVPLSQPLQTCGLFPPMVYHMVRIGEEAGSTEEMLNRLADYYEEEVEMAVQSLMAAMEPMIIIILAGIVGILLAAVMLPMVNMYAALDNL